MNSDEGNYDSLELLADAIDRIGMREHHRDADLYDPRPGESGYNN
jgi:hypothetical protein